MMSKLVWKLLFVSPAVLGATLIVSAGQASATEEPGRVLAESKAVTESKQTIEVKSLAKTANLQAQSVKIQATEEFAPATTEETVSSPEKVTVPDFSVVTPTQLDSATASPAVETLVAQTPPTSEQREVLEQINRYSSEGNSNSQNQVTNVSQLRDVSPGDWAFEALRSLVERYGCIAGYPDGTYRGNRPTTRFEFAAGLNACLQQIERLILAREDAVTREDFETLERLIQEFEAELATLGTRVDNLEGRVSFLEDHQFSTTTKLAGEAIFAVTDEFGTGAENNTVFQDRVRLDLNTTFTGQDRLVTRLAAGNAQDFNLPAGTLSEATQTFDVVASEGNDVVVDWLAYYGVFASSRIYLAASGGIHSDYAPTLNPYFDDADGGSGALSTFATQNPIYRIGGGAGGAISLGVGPLESILGPSTLTVGYLAGPDAADPDEKNGLFDGDYAALAQLNFNLGDRIGLGATYIHAYHTTGSPIFDQGGAKAAGTAIVGTVLANNPSSILAGGDVPVVTNSYGVQAAFRLSENISISGFGTYTDTILVGRGGGEGWTYGGGVALSDLGKEGNILGIFGGAQPYMGNIDAVDGNQRVDEVPYHVEAFYKYQLNDNISITPGVIWLINPNQEDQDDAVIGTLRTTFTF
ncbi:MAG: iron uptake porin [Coleofasciculaceae cyanobacterium]